MTTMAEKSIKKLMEDIRNITISTKTEDGIEKIIPVVKTEYYEVIGGSPKVMLTLNDQYTEWLEKPRKMKPIQPQTYSQTYEISDLDLEIMCMYARLAEANRQKVKKLIHSMYFRLNELGEAE